MPRAIAASSSCVLRINAGCFFISVNLPLVGFAQTDNPEGFAALREDDAIESGIDYDIAYFAQFWAWPRFAGSPPRPRKAGTVAIDRK
ncbi:hypothetical protein B0G83_10515 [Paraburkholderia sp. BL21I4N1]|nr:hypothetical protein B0G83_10515 [Paraburkholderia sp. BL21I4N1]